MSIDRVNNSLLLLKPALIGPIQKIENDIFTAIAVAPTGEQIYFAMEPIGDGEKWFEYSTYARLLANGGREDYSVGSLTEIGSRINDAVELERFFKATSYSEFYTHDKARFEELRTKLNERKITNNSAKAKEISAIFQAIFGFCLKSQTHIAYASKIPIVGRAKFDRSSSDQFCFGDYVDRYENLVMSVGVKIDNIVENRGIFRNPWSIVQGGYGGIAMMLHSFTCMVVEENWPGVKTFKVRPLKVMGEIFMSSLPNTLFTVDGVRADKYHKGFDNEPHILAPVKLLADLHRQKEENRGDIEIFKCIRPFRDMCFLFAACSILYVVSMNLSEYKFIPKRDNG